MAALGKHSDLQGKDPVGAGRELCALLQLVHRRGKPSVRLPAAQDCAAPGPGGGWARELPLKRQGSHTFPSRSYTVCLYRTQIQINPSVTKPRGRYRSTCV